MERALYIFLALYFPLLGTAGLDLFRDFRPEALGSPLFRLLIWLWLLDGLLCLVTGIGRLRRLYQARSLAGRGLVQALLAVAAILLGLPPAYILLELTIKIYQYYTI